MNAIPTKDEIHEQSLIVQVIRRLRERVPYFEDRIAGLADLKYLRTQENFKIPAAFVLPSGEGVPRRTTQGPLTTRFDILHEISIAVTLDATSDPRNQDTSMHLDYIRTQLVNALAPWIPFNGWGGFMYGGMQVGGQEADRANYMYSFSVNQSLWMNCGAEVNGKPSPAAETADFFNTWSIVPPLCDPDTGEPVHEKGVGIGWQTPACNPDPEASNAIPHPAFCANIKEVDNGSDDAC